MGTNLKPMANHPQEGVRSEKILTNATPMLLLTQTNPHAKLCGPAAYCHGSPKRTHLGTCALSLLFLLSPILALTCFDLQ